MTATPTTRTYSILTASTPRPILAPTFTPAAPAIQTPAWFRDLVLYKVFPRRYYDSNGDGIGDLKGITLQLARR